MQAGESRVSRDREGGGLRWRDKSDLFNNVQARAAEKLVNNRLREAAGVVFHPDGLGGFTEIKLADAVYVADLGDGEHGGLAWRNAVTIDHIKLRHEGIVAG